MADICKYIYPIGSMVMVYLPTLIPYRSTIHGSVFIYRSAHGFYGYVRKEVNSGELHPRVIEFFDFTCCYSLIYCEYTEYTTLPSDLEVQDT